MDPKKIARINELAKKKETEGLTPEEAVVQAKLREEYIEGYRRSVRHHIEGIKIVDEIHTFLISPRCKLAGILTGKPVSIIG